MKEKDILDEFDKRMRIKCKPVIFPLSEKEKQLIKDMILHLEESQTEEIALKKNLRPGMGLAANQLGVLKEFFVVVHQQEDKSFKNYFVANPKIISHSEELIYASEGEGCLSVNREVEGIVPRYARISVQGQDIDGNEVKFRIREEVSIAFQHEMDHLNGIIFVDLIDKNNPYNNKDNMRPI